MKESSIQKIVFDHLTSIAVENNFFCFSIPNESFMMAASIAGLDSKTKSILNMHLKKMGMVPGIPDLCIFYSDVEKVGIYNIAVKIPKTLFIELKKPNEKPSDIQKIIHEKIRSVGHSVVIAYSLEDVKKILNDYGVTG